MLRSAQLPLAPAPPTAAAFHLIPGQRPCHLLREAWSDPLVTSFTVTLRVLILFSSWHSVLIAVNSPYSRYLGSIKSQGTQKWQLQTVAPRRAAGRGKASVHSIFIHRPIWNLVFCVFLFADTLFNMHCWLINTELEANGAITRE